MKAFFRFVLLSLTLLVVALMSALTAMRFAIHGREVAVPDLVGKSPQEARRVAELTGFQFEVERQYYSSQVPAGKVLSQVPPAGTQIRRGWQIRVAESLGPQRVEIPNVIGQSQRAAEINILRRGLDVGAIARIEMANGANDQVVAQSPSPSASSISAPKISLLAEQPLPPAAFVMPSFTGQTLGSAAAAVQDAGLRLGTVTTAASVPISTPGAPAVTTSAAQPSPSSVIVSQNPTPGVRVVAGTVVNLEVRPAAN
jgi:beta-lactam-binding protein with PASTA domain